MDSNSPALTSLGGIVQWLDEMINQMLLTSVAVNLERIINAIWLPLELAVTIGLLIYGYLIATQQIRTPFAEALGHIVKIIFIVALIEAGGFYQTHIMQTMLALPDEMLQIITGSPDNARNVLADFHNSGLETATKLQERSPDFWTDMLRTVIFAAVSVLIVIMYTIVTVIGLLLMTVAKVGMALMVTIGPFFIAAALFQATKPFFTLWLQQALYFAFYGMLYTLVFSVVMGMLNHIQKILFYMTESDEINILQIMAVIFLVSKVAIFLLKLPSAITSKVTGGEGVDMPVLGRI